MDSKEVEEQLEQQASQLGVSSAKLRTVYRRGVSACVTEGYPESPVFHGLARVQRYVFAHQSKNSRYTLDDDLLPKDYTDLPESTKVSPAIEASGEWPFVYDLLNSNTLSVVFGNDTKSVMYDTDTKVMSIVGSDWVFTYSFSTGSSDMWYNF